MFLKKMEVNMEGKEFDKLSDQGQKRAIYDLLCSITKDLGIDDE